MGWSATNAQVDADVRLDLPEPMQLSSFLDLASQQLSLNIIYDPEALENQQVVVQTPQAVSRDALRELIDAVLRSSGYALAESDRVGWLRLVQTDELALASRVREPGQQEGASAVVTQVFQLRRVGPGELISAIRPFLTPGDGRISQSDSLGVLIVTDFADNVRRVERLIQRIENNSQDPVYRYYSVRHLTAADLSTMLFQALGAGKGAEAAVGVDVIVDEPANRLLLIGDDTSVQAAEAVAQSLDTDPGMQTQVYRFRHTTAQRFETQIRGMLEAAVSTPSFESSVDRQAGLMILTAPAMVHRRVEALRKELDVPGDVAASPIRFYALQNANAADVLETLGGLAEVNPLENAVALGLGPGLIPRAQAVRGGQPAPVPPALSSGVNQPVVENTNGTNDGDGPLPAVHTANATLTADENTNSIIVVADPATQTIYADLIEKLDQRRAQVMVETTLVVMDTSDNFQLGVDILAGNAQGESQSYIFNSFGLSQLDNRGSLTVSPGVGFNGVTLSADIADIVVQALKSDGNTKVVSAPRILINDNETGKIASVSGQPVANFNQGQNSDTVTFQGFVEAGTSIEMTPHIAEGDFLRLEFKVALESFTDESSSSNLPPPRQSNTVESHVTLPDGETIVVGGINLTNMSEQVNRIPILGEIPGIEYLFSSRQLVETQSTLFVFLRPVVLRQDNFDDLRFYSRQDAQDQGLGPQGFDASGYPISHPRWIR